ncbi:DUF3244 domain-containing protein [Belliella sp. R4-6]|uniref:DUF3244 domain-containing protein n=1 Tax=Belliella alkalica TaxID=1730871 RepID=A0ABS9VHE3_9BACT|nr:DUF3244 domain-containing protein [Belliella alkalica]MCH7415569.1 DUF3244 domain-containing protein [Belliella alkalica]
MKTLLTFALALSLSTSTFAKEGTSNVAASSYVKTEGKIVKLSLGEDLGKVRMTIKDVKGKTLYRSTIFVKSNVIVPFNLSEFPTGTFNIEVESMDKRDVVGKANFDVETKEPKREMVLPLMASGKIVDQNKVRLSVYGLEKPGLKVMIKDENGKLIFKETINEENGFIKFYNFKNTSVKGKVMLLEDIKGRQKTILL